MFLRRYCRTHLVDVALPMSPGFQTGPPKSLGTRLCYVDLLELEKCTTERGTLGCIPISDQSTYLRSAKTNRRKGPCLGLFFLHRRNPIGRPGILILIPGNISNTITSSFGCNIVVGLPSCLPASSEMEVTSGYGDVSGI
jgi:hypothetical protein